MVACLCSQPYFRIQQIIMTSRAKPESNQSKKVKIMKQANWIMNTNKVRTWAESQDPCDEVQAIMLSLTLGDNASSDELRSTYWTAIRSIGSTKDGFPTARRGRESNLTEEQQMVVDNVNMAVANAFAAIPTEYHETLLTVIVPHGRTGGTYSDYDSLTNNYKKAANSYMMKSIKEGRWDGVTANKNGVPQITPTAVKADGGLEEE